MRMKNGWCYFERFASILSDKGSGRDKVYKATFDLIINTDFTSFYLAMVGILLF